LHAPARAMFQVSPCEACGGQLELITKDSMEAEHLKKVIKECRDREGRFRVKLAELDARLETAQRERSNASKSHAEEVRLHVQNIDIRFVSVYVVLCRNEYCMGN
jgi:hypothetical protein